MNENLKIRNVSVRLPPDEYVEFKVKSTGYGGMSEVMRELIYAFIDGRLTVTAANPRKEMLYPVK